MSAILGAIRAVWTINQKCEKFPGAEMLLSAGEMSFHEYRSEMIW